MESERSKLVPRASIQMPPIPKKNTEMLSKNKKSFKEQLLRKLILQILLSCVIVFSIFMASQSKTDFARKVQTFAKSSVTYQMNLKEVKDSGQRIAGYVHEKVFNKK